MTRKRKDQPRPKHTAPTAAGLALLMALTPAPVLAQDAAPPLVAPAPEAAAPPLVTPPLVQKANGHLLLNFQDAHVNAALDELSAAAGLVIVKEVKPEGRVTLLSRQPVDTATAVSLLNTVLRTLNLAAVQQGRILKIVALDQAKKMGIPVRVGNDPTQIEPTDELITQVIPLRSADATQLKQDLQPLISPGADFASNQSSNALVITDTAANVKRLVEIVSALDSSIAQAADVRVFQLKFADATAAAKLITDVFANADLTATNPMADFIPPWRRQQRDDQQRQQNTGSRSQTKVTASADSRTNTVVVAGPAASLEAVARILRELDANPTADETVFVYHLRNANAQNLEAVVNDLFNGTQSSRSNTSNSTNSGSTLDRSSRSGQNTRTVGGSTGGSSSNSRNLTSSNRFGNNTQGFTGGNVRLSQQAMQTASDLAGKVTIIADVDTNALLVRASPTHYERIKAVLDEMDKPVPQVLIKVLFAEVTHDNGLDFGTEFSILNLRPSGNGQSGGTSFNIPVAGASATGLVVQIMEENFTATIRALETQGKLDVLSRPYILASDNQLASITVGQEVPFITNSRITTDGQTLNTIEYGDVGILLDVIPHINQDGTVILDVAPEISTLTGTTVPISELIDAPVIAKRSAFSRVAVNSGQTIVIGGLIEDRTTQTINKVPILGDIPLLGWAFKRTQDKKSKTELLIFLTPHVAQKPDVLPEMGQREVEGTTLVPGAVAPGVYDQHRAGMERGDTSGSTPAPAATSSPGDGKAPQESPRP